MTSVLHYRDPIACRSYEPMSTANYVPNKMATLKQSSPYDGHSSGSESKKQHTPGAKRRPSRAGTRSVSTLTAAQLERKRANDREAQRAIRQRTKDHIEGLERQVRDLTARLDSNPSTKMVELTRRNEELEQENAVLRRRLSHALAALGVSEQNAATGGAPSPSDRIQMLSQPRRSSTGTSRSVHSVPEMATPASQPGHWQPPHAYPPNISSPHIETSSGIGEVSGQQDGVRYGAHQNSHPQHHAGSLPVQDPALHAVDNSGMPYPGPYGMDSNSRSMSYPLENAQLVTSQPMQMSGYGTPTSNPSPHPSDYQRHMSVPMNAPQAPHAQHPHPHSHSHLQPQQQAHYTSYPNPGPQGYAPQVTHPGEMHMMAPAPQSQPQMMGEQGNMMYHMPPNMKVEQH
ncbi:hypothetical protein BU24DRAFT_389064 [Aaosphaeria arxii CBS 175.79]|uniref:BZIP domain-containing protein n=1 Tax=Aaosphaeria arxii CBS 175.79 TaxID=1450172 RepID=A0A6A5XWV4_9PLEO|nr:uncharacterized protein BU24DRAFT_389064 [Aaosphaeria arxii CBS 175.79]KAF2017642.1 hypothetical protein BU24DRAFT_389064 [Aaosphaeria arxii CBS 175.79]